MKECHACHTALWDTPGVETLATILEKLFTSKHTGPMTIHFAQGRANSVEIPGEPMRIRLEKRRAGA